MKNFTDHDTHDTPRVQPPIIDGVAGTAGEEQPSGFLWLFYLYLRPRTFFTHFVIEPSPGLTALCAWLYGMASAIDRIETRMLRGGALGLEDSWPAYWGFVAAIGILGGLFYFAIGGWWYRLRLQWSGAQDPDARLARRVYLYASQVLVLPVVFTTAVETAHYQTPLSAFNAEGSWWYLALPLFSFWSCWTSFAGARTAFELRRGRALLWFLVLPSLLYVVVVGGVLFAGAAGVFNFPPDVAHPQKHNSAAMTFSYPGNWWIDDAHQDYDPNTDVYVEPMQDAWVHIMIYESYESAEAELESTMTACRALFRDSPDTETFETWGRYSGTGRTLRGTMQDVPAVLRAFVTRVPGGNYLEISECCAAEDEADVLPGFEQIRSSLRLKP